MAAQLIEHNNIIINTHTYISIWAIFKYLIPAYVLGAVNHPEMLTNKSPFTQTVQGRNVSVKEGKPAGRDGGRDVSMTCCVRPSVFRCCFVQCKKG